MVAEVAGSLATALGGVASGVQRVVVNGRFLTQPATGVQRYALETLMALDRLVGSGELPAPLRSARFELAVPPGARATEPLRHIRRVEVDRPASRGHAWEQLSLALHARGAFLVNFGYSGPIAKRRQIITIHDAAVRAFPESYSRSYRWLHDGLVTLLKRRVRCVMTVSEFSRQELLARYQVPPQKLVVGTEGWEHAVSHAEASVVRTRFGLEPDGYALCVGSLKPSKNLEVVARALRLVEDPGLVLAVAGAADPRLFGRSGSPDLQADPRVRMLGFVSDEELGALYRHARVFVMPSLYEGFGLPALEAMGNGCPVIAARAASLPEICGPAADYFDPDDAPALARCLSAHFGPDGGRTDRRRTMARECLARYGWTASARGVGHAVAGAIAPA